MTTFIGENVILRDSAAGVFVGTLEDKNGKSWTLRDARKIHYWTKAAAVEGLATRGFGKDSRITPKVRAVCGEDFTQAVLCEPDEYAALMAAPEWQP